MIEQQVKPKQIHMEVDPIGFRCRVIVDGVDLSRYMTKSTIVIDPHELTRVTLELVSSEGEPYVIDGHFVPEHEQE